MSSISLILLSGGEGLRFGSPIPKQYLPLQGKVLALHSFDFFCDIAEISEIVVVCAPAYRGLFSSPRKPVFFAEPGKRRQDSVFSGLCKTSENASLVCIHDAARPFPDLEQVKALFKTAREVGASALAVPASNTIKECSLDGCVKKTLPRETLWEMQTPQAIRKSYLVEAFEKAHRENWEVTDDVSLIEKMGKPVKITPGSSKNLKVTTRLDLAVLENLHKFS